MSLRTALLFQAKNFVGREYFAALDAAGRRPDLLAAVGTMSATSIAREIARTGGLWNPPDLPSSADVQVFAGTDDPTLDRWLCDNAVDVAIQGGIGILKPPLLFAASIGFLNVHPGRLPQYRGNSCPEWALSRGEDVVATAHLIDEGIDTGPVICARAYRPRKGETYAQFRAALYAHCASVMIEALQRLEDEGAVAAVAQDEGGAHYWPPMPESELTLVKQALASR